MPRISTDIKSKQKSKRRSIICTKCGHTKTASIENFFKTDNPMYDEFFPTCKDCVYQEYNSYVQEQGMSLKEATIKICESLDKPFIDEVFNSTYEKEKDNTNFLGVYFKNSAMQQWRKRGVLRYRDSIFGKEALVSSQGEEIVPEPKIYSEYWNGYYTQTDINYLDDYISGLSNDFKIVTTNHKDYAKKICQASLAVNKAYQDMLNGVSGADKRYKDLQETFDKLSKSAQFSESQRGANDVSLGCFGVLFDKVEQKKWIHTHVPLEKDDFDRLIDYFSTIYKSVK